MKLMVALLGIALLDTGVHPSLAPQRDALEKCWYAGSERAKKEKEIKRAYGFAQRGIGRQNGKTSSRVTWLHPRLLAFEQGFVARKWRASEEKVQPSPVDLAHIASQGERKLRFRCELAFYPQFGEEKVREGFCRPSIVRKANIQDLNSIAIYLEVGNRRYSPVDQPGNVEPTVHEDALTYTEPAWRSRTYRDRDGTTGHIPDYGRPRESTLEYRWFSGTCEVVFDLYNADGTPRIRAVDKEITVLVEGQFGKRKALYRLQEWLTAYEK